MLKPRGSLLTAFSLAALLLLAAVAVRSYRVADIVRYRREPTADSGRVARLDLSLAAARGRFVFRKVAADMDADAARAAAAAAAHYTGPPGFRRSTMRPDGLPDLAWGESVWRRMGFRFVSSDRQSAHARAWNETWIAAPAWAVAAPFAVLPGIAAARALARRSRRRRGLCPQCGYNLRESPDRCPECGEPAAADPAPEDTSGAGPQAAPRRPQWRALPHAVAGAAAIAAVVIAVSGNPPAPRPAPGVAAPAPPVAAAAAGKPAPIPPGDTHVYAVGMQIPPGTAVLRPRVQVFRRIGDRWRSHVFTPDPGDTVGGVVGGVDLSTPYVLTDFRLTRRERSASLTLADPDGRTTTRDTVADRDDPVRKQLESEAVPAERR